MIPPRIAARIRSIVVGASGVFLLLALGSFHPADLSLLSSEANSPLRNIGGVVGAWVAFLARGGFGWASWLLPLFCGIFAVRLWQDRLDGARWVTRTLAGLCLLASAGTVLALGAPNPSAQTQVGGAMGYLLVRAGRYYLGAVGTALLAGCIAVLSWFLVVGHTSLPHQFFLLLKRIGHALGAVPLPFRRIGMSPALPQADERARASEPSTVSSGRSRDSIPATVPSTEPPRVRIRSTVTPKPKTMPMPAGRNRQVPGGFQLPPIDLLTTPPPLSERQLGEDPHVNARILEETLKEFGIEAKCVNIDRGPTITRYELAPAPGVKLTKIVSLADDLALVLKAASCHIVAPIPGKSCVGVDVPNSTATTVYLKEVITAKEFSQLASPLALAIGQDVSGQPVVCDLREFPHLLLAGATGSGKTACLNSLLSGILYHASPDEVKFLMIDPKKVELVLFNDIPHLVAPVVTDAKRAAVALRWAAGEMDRRYQLLAKVGVRNIELYNQKIQRSAEEPEADRLPYLVIVIDELADLMVVASQEVEEAITRLSQLSRAVGLHVILATQRPSVDVITGVIKANFPARIAFQVASKVDSRTILDVNGADKLLGRGDLLFLRPGTAKPMRAQGSLVTDEEIERVVAYVKTQRQPVYDERLMAKQEKPQEAWITEKDELYEMAKRLVLETGQASTSLLQRRLRLGYARAARILDLMEQEGLVGPPQGSRPREILVSQHVMEHQG